MNKSHPIKIHGQYKLPQFVSATFALIGLAFSALYALVWQVELGVAHLGFLLVGPGQLAVGVWSWVYRPSPQLRLSIDADGVWVRPDGRAPTAVQLNWSELNSVTQTGASHRDTRLRFSSTTGDYVVTTRFLDRSPAEVLRLITIQLENVGKHLSEVMSPVLGAPTGVWEVRDGIPFAPD